MSIAQEQPASAKYEAFLDARLNQARQQVRWMDIGVGAVGLAALTLGYALIMLAVDRELHLPTYVRQISLLGFVAFATWYVLRVLLIPLRTQVNPYYAAKKVEHVIPQSKNSLVSWLDLRDRHLAEPIRDAIGRKAATDLSHANVHDAVRDRRLARAGIVMTVLAVVTLGMLLALRPPQFFSLLERAFLPFRSTAVATQTVIKIIEPAGGDTTVSVNQSVFIRVEVDGRNPKLDASDSVRLKMRYQPSDTVWEERRLDPTDRDGEWRIQVPAASVRTGFEYQVVGGDAATSIYRVKVRAKAMITDFEVTYRYRPYLGFADDVRADPNLSAFCGTNVTLLAKTNRPIKDGVLKFAPNSGAAHPPLAAIPMPDRPDTLKFVFQLDQSGKYRLQFTSSDAEASEETLPFDINVLPDLPPKVDFTKPVQNPLPVNGIMFIHGKATDDFGLTNAKMIFRMRSAAGAQPEVLQSVPLRDRQSLTQPDGKFPRQLELKAAIPLESLVDAMGAKPTWQPSMVLEYAIEAEDNYDNPSPQVGRTPWESVTIGDPASKEQKQQAQDAANQLKNEEKDKQDQQQDKNGKQGNKGQGDKDQKNEDQSKDGSQDQGKGDKNEQGKSDQKQGNEDKQDGKQDQGKGDKNQPGKPDQKPANDAKQGDKQEGDNKSDNPQQQKQQPLTPEEKKTLDAAKKLEDALRDEQKGDKPDANTEKKEGGDQPGDPNAHPDNKQPKPGDKDKPQPEKGDKQDSKGQGEERKPGDNTDKQGEKPGKGDVNKSNDQDPKTSPDQGKEDGGKGSSERGDKNEAGDKSDKPEDKAKSGQSDPKAKPKDDGKPDGAKSKGGNPGNDKGKTEPDSGAGDAKKDNSKPDKPGNLEEAPDNMKGGDNKTDAKPDGKGKQQGKPGDSNDQPKPGDKQSNGNEADRNEIQKMIEDFKNADPKQQKEITDKLNDMAKNAPSQKQRDAAKEAMEKLDRNNSSTGKQGEQDKAKPDAKPKDKSDQGKGEKPDSKPGDEQTGEGPAKENPQKNATEKGDPGKGSQRKTEDDKKKSADAPPNQGNQPTKPTQPGSGQPGGNTRGDVNSSSGNALGAPNEGFTRQAGELQLDTFRNKVDRKVLDRVKMTDQEYQDFLKAYEKLVQKQKEAMPQPGDRARGDAKGTSAANSGAKKVDGQAGGPKVDRSGRGTAPADIRDQYRDFTEQQSKQK